jgi:F420-0:gamma-glutamyl ligase
VCVKFLKVKTRVLVPPKDDLLAVLDEFLPEICNGDILLIATKVLAIHQGRCVSKGKVDKLKLIEDEADSLSEGISDPCLTIKNSALIPNSGVDESNGNGYYILWPRNIENLLRKIHTFVSDKFHLSNLGVISVDSCVLPMRIGTVGISQDCFGFLPVIDLVGKNDLFGRPLKMSRINVADSLAGIAPLLMGEAKESCPVVIARGIEEISFSKERLQPNGHLIDKESDLFGNLLKFFRKK